MRFKLNLSFSGKSYWNFMQEAIRFVSRVHKFNSISARQARALLYAKYCVSKIVCCLQGVQRWMYVSVKYLTIHAKLGLKFFPTLLLRINPSVGAVWSAAAMFGDDSIENSRVAFRRVQQHCAYMNALIFEVLGWSERIELSFFSIFHLETF